MILIADSGATKTDWVALDDRGNHLFYSQTKGLSPEAIGGGEMISRLDEAFDIAQNKDKVVKIFFYGAGCGTIKMKEFVRVVLKDYFTNIEEIIVEEDTYGAAYATTAINTKAIVCILGTGSNCSLYDGKILHQKVLSLGYILMDDCSGNRLGVDLIRAYNFNTLPKELAQKMQQEYTMDMDEIKFNLYMKSDPNAYLATFAKFIIENKNHEFMQGIINKQMQTFIDLYIKQYDNCYDIPINFIGSIAFCLRSELEHKLTENNLNLGVILQQPIDGLINYVINYKL